MAFQWSGNDFQVKADNLSIYYSIKASLYSVGSGQKWNQIWGTGW